MSLVIIAPPADRPGDGERLEGILARALAGRETVTLRRAEELSGLVGKKLLFALPLGEFGINLAYVRMLERLRREPGLLEGCVAGLIVDGSSALYTKSAAAELTLAANLAGCAFLGRPLVEGTGELLNLRSQAKNLGCGLEEAYAAAARELAQRLEEETFPRRERPNLLVLHASSHKTSNTMALWERIRQRLEPRCDITEVGLRNGVLVDCSGCPYQMCLHFGERGSCFYGGVMVEEVYPSVRQADALVLLCPNYNDAVSANLTACINRLTALFRTTRFDDKAVYGIVVSGYSGGDIVAEQLLGALCMNKAFYLPPRFVMTETANDAGTVLHLPGIEDRLEAFAQQMLDQLAEI